MGVGRGEGVILYMCGYLYVVVWVYVGGRCRCVSVYEWFFMFVEKYMCLDFCVCMWSYICECTSFICMLTYMSVFTNITYICMYEYIYANMHACYYVYVYVYICLHVRLHPLHNNSNKKMIIPTLSLQLAEQKTTDGRFCVPT